eukprot:TRINITY_DN919_c0_g1_i9.p1 TRINITY_DN919_c0_g1~~TRINITY_DN919_c0_g1_i9.p1  ORF type:complete len:108 (+),score=17.98 TRINITY_DN919_c0_g1_i9:143-466(+)
MKTVFLVRHGESEHNAVCVIPGKEEEEEEDPFFFDSCLSQKGRQQVQELAAKVKASNLRPKIVITSPLSRALETAVGGFGHLEEVRTVFYKTLQYFSSSFNLYRLEG